jgi:signal transduction histidine kinase/ActR/RegA family two-component response regulator
LSVKDELAGQLTDLRRLHEMSARLSMVLELQPILEETLHTATAIEKTDLGVLAICDEDQTELRVGASLGFDDEYLRTIEHDPPLDGACSTCFDERRRVVVEDVEAAHFYAPYRDIACRAGFRAVHSTPLITRTGKIVGVLSTYFRVPHRPSNWALHLIDLCARQAVDFIENARLYQQLREADRRKDEFLATLAHELRNPLAPICNSLQLLRLSDDLPPAVRHIREIMEQQVNHMVRLVDDLLEVARITRGKIELRKEVIDLSSVISQAAETSRTFVESAGHQLALSFPAKPLAVEADPVRLAQVVSNLLNNAAKYTASGGQIWLTIRRQDNQAYISVRDNGQGISAEMLPRVFEMFAQVERGRAGAHSGLGIGLALAKRLVEMHGGQIDAYSSGVECGSEFVVRLPLVSSGSGRKRSRKTVSRKSADIPRRSVLVVDDAPASAYILSKLLEALGQEVITASEADAALKLARARRPQIIFSDIAMPDMNGYELARQLRLELGLKDCKLVALTGYSQDGDRQQAKAAGFDHYLVKPVSVEALQTLLASLPNSTEPDRPHLRERL